MILKMPWPTGKGLSPNDRCHWSVKAKSKAALRQAWKSTALSQGAEAVAAKSLHISLTFYCPDKRARDLDNLLSCCKAGLDGLCEVLGVDDSKWRISIEKSDQRGGFVRVAVTAAEV